MTISQNKVQYIAGLTVFVAGAIVLLASPLAIRDVWQVATRTVSITVGIVLFFDKWLWKFFPERLLGIPKVYGTWRGTLCSEACDLVTGNCTEKIVNPLFLVIRQDFTSIRLTACTAESSSISLASKVLIDPDGGAPRIFYAYDNSPQLRLQQQSRRHRGAAELAIISSNGTRVLKGEYWTDRWSQGSMKLVQHCKTLVDSFESANSLRELS